VDSERLEPLLPLGIPWNPLSLLYKFEDEEGGKGMARRGRRT